MNSVTMPELEPLPWMPQKRSGSEIALVVMIKPAAVMIVACYIKLDSDEERRLEMVLG